MIYALSLNPSMDKTVCLNRFFPDAPNRVTVLRMDAGGKGVNVARAIHALGGGAVLVGFDYDGGPIASAMEKEKVPCRLIGISGTLRVNLKIQEEETGRTIEINEQGPRANAKALEEIKALLLSLAQPGDWISLSGSLPAGAKPETYGQFCAALREKGCFPAVDCDGPSLEAALQARPALLKPNAQEFAALTKADPADDRAAVAACRDLIRQYGLGKICLSRGGDGALLVSRGDAWRCPAARVKPQGLQGAGDTMLAALMLSFSGGLTDPAALRFSIAAAGASVMRPGTLLCQSDDVEALLGTLPPAQPCP